ncbi:epiphycan isoform X2 [Megalobrama amblycephala]|uniref:epiphycan isoform X2 n=1 Tax=Megalobrama amblycephala TaxID=75352 RepID=UPI002013C90A|nr:epiphycan isoform X2 [Megalobrama amblycephala]
MVTLRLMWGLLVLCVVAASPPRYARQAELDKYDNNNVDLDLNVDADDAYDYYDAIDEPQIEIGTLGPDEDIDPSHGASLEEEEEEENVEHEEQEERRTVEGREHKELPRKPQLIPSGSGESGTLMGPSAQGGMATCMLCTCLVGSVYCDDLKLDRVPPLSKETTHFYARYNKIARISKSDFANLNKLKKIDLTSNGISRIDDDAFFGLPALEELILRENSIRQLPALPPSMTLIDACHNQLGNTGIQREAFKDMPGLLYLYLTDNNIDHIPVPLPDSLRSLHLQNNNIQMMHEDTFCNPHDLNYIRNALEDVRLDGNPINLSRTPQAYICLPRIPIGALI